MSAIPRSNRPEVRNPILAMPEVLAEIEQLDPNSRAALAKILNSMSKVFRGKAEHAWHARKGPLALYARTNSVYARHMSLALRQINERQAADAVSPGEAL